MIDKANTEVESDNQAAFLKHVTETLTELSAREIAAQKNMQNDFIGGVIWL